MSHLSKISAITCPVGKCGELLYISQWNDGHSNRHLPRLLHDIDKNVLLVSCLYTCKCKHEILSTDPRILQQLPEQEYIPFILFHRSAVMRSFARSIIHLVIEGMSMSSVEHFIKIRRIETMMSLDAQVKYILALHGTENSQSSILDNNALDHLYKPFPSNDLVLKCFVKDFFENKEYYFASMASLVTSTHISLDHTFKIATNIGCLRPDGKWTAQYNSVLFVQNDAGQVISWMFTKTTSLDEAMAILKPDCIIKLHIQVL